MSRLVARRDGRRLVFVTLLALASILSRGLVKRGTGNGDDGF